MKKIKIFTLILLFMGLSGCNLFSDEEYINLAPEVLVEDSYYIEVGDTSFSLSDNISISDDQDGDILVHSSMIDYKNFDINVLGSYEVLLRVSDSSGATTNKLITIHVVDTTIPWIELIGDDFYNLTLGYEYVELGAILSDNYDSDLTLIILGEVDIHMFGDYTLEYYTEDSSGNRSASLFRTVNIIANLPLIALTNVLATQEKITFELNIVDTDLTGTLTSIELYQGEELTEALSDLTIREFHGPFNNVEYKIVVTYTYDLNDGVGEQIEIAAFEMSFSYTYRTTTVEIDSLNPHVYEMTHESTAMGYMMNSLYEFTFKANPYDGFEIVPAMAIAEPLDVSSTTPSGAVDDVETPWDETTSSAPGTVWRIALNPATAWANGTLIDADDFMYSYRMLIDPRMANYRGDAFHTGIVVVGAKEYFEQDYTYDVLAAYGLTFDTVGIKKIDAHTLEFTLVFPVTAWDVKYNLSSPITGVIDETIYEANMDEGRTVTTYGTSLDTVRSNGAFELVEWQKGIILTFEANPNYFEAGDFQTTHIRMDVIADQSVILQLFNQGKLDVANVGSTEYDNYKYDSRLKLIESTVTWRLVMNGAERPDGETKPIMLDLDFRMALFHVFDRAELASTLAAPSTPASTLLSSLYLVDVAAGTSYRSTLAGISVTEGMFPETDGYNLAYAISLYEAAYANQVSLGNITHGDIITLEVLNYTAETSVARNNWVKDQVEAAFEFIAVEAVAHPDRYTKYEEGNYDFGWAGWSGEALDPLGFMIVWENAAYRSEYSFDPTAEITVTHDDVLDVSGEETRTYREWYWSTNPPFLVEEVLTGGEYYGPEASGDLRTWILAAMEKEIIAQGVVVPLYQLRYTVIYHGRVQFPVDSYQPIMGYGDIKDYTYTALDQELD